MQTLIWNKIFFTKFQGKRRGIILEEAEEWEGKLKKVNSRNRLVGMNLWVGVVRLRKLDN